MTPAVVRQRVIPFGGWVAAGIVLVLGFLLVNLLLIRDSEAPIEVRFLLPILAPLALAGYTLLIGYVYGDARRRRRLQSTGGNR